MAKAKTRAGTKRTPARKRAGARKVTRKVAKAAMPRPPREKSRKSGSLTAQAYEQIKEKILTLHFLPGQYLNEGALCALLEVGRTPVHQALQRLQHEVHVRDETRPQRHTSVLPASFRMKRLTAV